MLKKLFLLLLSLSFFPVQGGEARALYNTLDSRSVAVALAFYELYPETEEGKEAIKRISALIGSAAEEKVLLLTRLINPLKSLQTPFTEEDLRFIEDLASHLPNRKLKGYQAISEEEMIALPPEEIDLGRALILSQMEGREEALFQTRCYSALLDLMALQILAHLPSNATVLDKIQEMNRFIFDQMHFRFPPHSVYAENIDLYTFLPSVMDNHLGVCLGVTALYLALAQRIDLPLEIVTPPGHIYVRCRIGEDHINIETTARGIHLPDETYLSLENFDLELRTLKEVVGMTHVNQASIYLYKGEFGKAVLAYEKALPYMPEDPLVKELLGYSYLFTQQKEKGEAQLKGLKEKRHSMGDDYFAGKIDLEGMAAVFILVDETRDSLFNKQKTLEKVVEKFPEFKDGLDQLAITWIQLNRFREAISLLQRSFQLDPEDATTAYYLSVLHGERQDFKNCWHYLKKAEEIAQKKQCLPQALIDLRRELTLLCPE
jgi:tetratricopeptide (TPR) repeat protein